MKLVITYMPEIDFLIDTQVDLQDVLSGKVQIVGEVVEYDAALTGSGSYDRGDDGYADYDADLASGEGQVV